jgi:nucleoside-diphosphate-sugar epimerase
LDLTDAALAAQAVLHPERFRGKSILVAGASGLIGSLTVRTLHELNRSQGLGITITAASRSREKLLTRFADMDDVFVLGLDVAAPGTALDGRNFDFILHAASQADPASFKKYPAETMLTNIEGTKNLLDVARQIPDSTLVYVSSGEVYGETTDDGLMSEGMSGFVDPTSPRSCYPTAKRASETLCVSYAEEYGVDALIVRPSHVYGPGFRPSDSRISADFFVKALRGEDIVMRSPRSDWRTYVYVSDCVSAILSVATSGVTAQAYNVTNSDNLVTMRHFAQQIATEGHVKFTAPAESPHASGEMHRASALNDAKLRSLGWLPQVSFDDGVRRTFAVLRAEAE